MIFFNSNDLSQPPKKEKEIKKKKQVESLTTDSRKEGVCRPVDDISDIPSTGEVTTDGGLNFLKIFLVSTVTGIVIFEVL